MSKNFIHKTIAISLALLMFCTSFGFSLDAHYCQNELRGISFFGKAKSCQDQVTKACKVTKGNNCGNHTLQNNDCCRNETIVVDAVDSDQISSSAIELTNINIQLIYSLITTSFCESKIEFEIDSLFSDFRPPPPKTSLQVLFQCFLI